METVRPWAYRIWKERHGRILHVLASDGPALQDLIREHGELVVMYAWALYVYDEQPLYNLEPVKHVDEFTSKKGNRIVQQIENEAAVTKYPLALFVDKKQQRYTAFIFQAADAIEKKSQGAEPAWRACVNNYTNNRKDFETP